MTALEIIAVVLLISTVTLISSVIVTEKVHSLVFVSCKCIYTRYVYIVMHTNFTTGYLCGDCRDGKGVSALLNRCADCSNANGVLIAVLSKNFECMYATGAFNVCFISSHRRCSFHHSLVVQRCYVLHVALSNYIFY